MIPGVPSFGGAELLIILVIVLLFFGAKRIPELGRSLGKGARELRKGISEGAADDDEAQDRLERDREKPSVDGTTTTNGEAPGAKAETTSEAERKT